ncbi:ABC-2 type transport system ATP-binding protein [Humidesulfovibrio mexicanus]|uniref:ABC-2 type transport system ATP-binding protein n=1 Tax=Humidesulfovibrio mexicanus TaxID=147047 RepID=A0A239A3E5_9BACT|nr:ABC transporter ATP-binding protein [Humidesulfovibrio mexicanus]SNR90176.1 ABC-2 type transport system ATP-binding protein [Humidesulfovibrio mexicanus]
MIVLEGLAKNYGPRKALAGVDLRVRPGELFAYLGPNGAGKTTTIRILTGLSLPDGGRALIDGVDVVAEPTRVKALCGVVAQAVNLDQDLSVAENLDVHGRLFGMSAAMRRSRAAEALEKLEIAERRRSLVRELSGGQRRRVMIARALMHEPRVLFLDEPTVGLDPSIRRKLWAVMKRIRESGTTILLTTHYIEEAEFLADRVAFLDRGRVVALGPPSELMDGLGAWAVDVLNGADMRTSCFRGREEAQAFGAAGPGSFTLRRVNLEDVFHATTGRKLTNGASA